jgi:hypothetical protein
VDVKNRTRKKRQPAMLGQLALTLPRRPVTWRLVNTRLAHNGLTALETMDANLQLLGDFGCWVWTGKLRSDGYAELWTGMESHLLHRLTYTLYRAEIPVGLDLDHLCRVKACCNPWHLEPVTRSTNVRRAQGFSRFKGGRLRVVPPLPPACAVDVA